MRTARIITVAGAIGVSGLLLTSCGDDTEALSKPELLEQADAICQVSTDQAELIFDDVFEDLDELDLEDPASEGVLFARFAEAAAQVEPIWGQMVDDLRELEEPEEDHEFIETLLDDLDDAMNDFVETTAAAANGDQAAMQAINGDTDLFDDVNRRALDYGLTVCGQE